MSGSGHFDKLRAELATHGKTCDCAHKKMCEDREEWLIAEIQRIRLDPERVAEAKP